MFGKILRAGKGGHGLKYKIDLQVIQLENLPTAIKKCRVVWARSAKLQITDTKDVRGSVASFKQTLTQVTTIYRDKTGRYEPKEYEFKVQVPGKSSSDSPVTVGKATLDMANYCKEETRTQPAMVPITFKIGTSTTGYLKLSITTIFLGDSNDDGLTEVSGLTGLTSDHGSVREQDLEGFADEENGKFGRKAKSGKRDDGASSAAGPSGRSGSSNSRPEARRHKPLPPTAEEDASDLEDEPERQRVLITSKSGRKKPSAARSSEIEVEAEDAEANPFAKKVTKPPSRRVAPKVWEDDEDVSPLNSDVSDSEPPKPAAKAKASKPDESLDDMKASLFATKKTAASSAGRAATGAAATAASGGASSSTSSSKAPVSKPSKAPAAPPPPPDDEEDESLRNDLFTAKPRSSGVAGTKPKAATAAAAAAAAGAAEVAAAASRQQKSKAVPPPRRRDEEDSEEEDEDDYGPSTSGARPAAAAPKSRSKAAEVSEPPTMKGSSSLTRAGSSKPDTAKAGSAVELEQLRQRITQLEKQLGDEQTAKEDLNKKLHKYTDRVADLEDQLAEGDLTELFAQMKEMEAKHQAQIKEMETKYQAEIKELMERHLAEVSELDERHQAELADLEEAASSSGRGGASVEELKRLQDGLAEQEALLKSRTAKLEAEQAAANAARQAAEFKLAEANRMIDESLMVATKHQQENKALQEEVARLKRQLEDASTWDTSAAVAAATSAAINGRRSSEGEAEVEELREKLEELQEENARLQRLNEAAQGAADGMLHDIRTVLHDAQGAGSLWSGTGSSNFDQLSFEARRLCDAYTRQSSDLRSMQDRLADMQHAAAASARTSASGEPGFMDGSLLGPASGASAKVKPHELLSRVQQLSAERDSLQDKLASQRQVQADLGASQRQAQADLGAAQKLVAELRQQVDTLTFEKQAVERFKVATIADLRRQNDQLRSSLRSLSSVTMSPRAGIDEDLLPVGTPQPQGGETRVSFVGSMEARVASDAGGAEDNWHEFESLVSQLKADRVDLQRQVEQLKVDKAFLGKQVEDLRSGGGAMPVAAVAVTASVVAGATGELGLMYGDHQLSRQRVADLELECTTLQAEVARLQAQLAELSEADTIIKEWSDYADGLVAEKTRLEQQVQELSQRLGAGSLASDLRVADAERRMTDWQRRAIEAEHNVTELERQAVDLELCGADAVARAVELERQLEAAAFRALQAERIMDAAERRALEAEGLAELAEQRATDAESRASAPDVGSVVAVGAATASAAASPMLTPRQQQPADPTEVLELRRQIARLEESLSLLRTQLLETQSPAVSPGANVASSALAQRGPWGGGAAGMGALSDAGGSQSEEEEVGSGNGGGAAVSPDAHMDRGWHAELEAVRARNASLEATVAGLHASLEVAYQQAGNGDTSLTEHQIQDLQSRLAHVLQDKAELESTVVLLRAELERAPLVPHGEGALEPGDSAGVGSGVAYHNTGASARAAAEDVIAAQPVSPAAADEAAAAALQEQLEALEEEVAQLRKERFELRAGKKELQLEVQQLEEDKDDAEVTISRLSSEMEELAEALEACNSENERLSLEVLSLRDQLEQLEGSEERRASGSQSVQSSKSARASSGRASESGGSGLLERARSAQVDAENELAAVRVATRELIRQVAAGSNAQDGVEEEPAFGGLGDDGDLAQALMALQVQISELQRQSQQQRPAPMSRTSSNIAAAAVAAAAAAGEVQLAKATARIDELQQLLEDAEIENQHLTEQLEETLTGGRKGPDSVGSVAEECQSSYGGSVAAAATGTSNPYSYGHANTLTLSAFEQRLAMVEGQRDELTASLAEASSTNRRLEADVAALQQELAAVRGGQDPSTSGGLERSLSQVGTRGRASRAASDADDKRRLEELQAANRKLEAVCDDLEEKAHVAQERAEQLEAELEATKEKILGLEAAAAAATSSAAALQKRMDEEMAGTGGRRQSKEKVADLEARVARLAREKATLEEQLEEERETRKELEETLKDKLDRAGDDEAAETVAAFEVKYNRLKERYKMLEESSQEELDDLQDQLTEAQSHTADLQRQVKQLQSQIAQNRSAGAAGGAGGSSANLEELRNLRSENDRLVQQLVAKKMELAEMSEGEITMRRELSRLHEVNMKLAQKATTLEAQAVMSLQAASGGKAGRGKK